MYGIVKALLKVTNQNDAATWLASYLKWCEKWKDFLAEATVIEGRKELTHERLVRAKASLDRLISAHRLFTYLDDLLTLDRPMPATNNRIEGGVNTPIRQMLREHRGMGLMRRIKAVFWWCYMNCDCCSSAAETLKVMPTDDEITEIYKGLAKLEELAGSIP